LCYGDSGEVLADLLGLLTPERSHFSFAAAAALAALAALAACH
jgi:hypothetical protein